MSLPPSTSSPVAQKISPGGIPYYDNLVLLDTVTGQAWELTIASSVVHLAPIPTVADIRADFTTVAGLRTAVSTVAALRTWGFA